MRIELEIYEKFIYYGKTRNAHEPFTPANQKAARAAPGTAVCKYTILRATYINSEIS